MTTKLAGVAIQQAGTLYQVPTTDTNGLGTRALASNAVDGLLRLLGRETYFKFQSKAFELAPNAHRLEDVPLDVVVQALRFACGADSGQVQELQELPADPNAPVFR